MQIKGWVHKVRDLGKIKFLLIRDGYKIMQAVIKKGESPDYLLDLDIPIESAVEIEGEERETNGKKEILVKDLKILAKAELKKLLLKKGLTIEL